MKWSLGSLTIAAGVEGNAFMVRLLDDAENSLAVYEVTDLEKLDAVVAAIKALGDSLSAPSAPEPTSQPSVPTTEDDDFGGAVSDDDFGGAAEVPATPATNLPPLPAGVTAGWAGASPPAPPSVLRVTSPPSDWSVQIEAFKEEVSTVRRLESELSLAVQAPKRREIAVRVARSVEVARGLMRRLLAASSDEQTGYLTKTYPEWVAGARGEIPAENVDHVLFNDTWKALGRISRPLDQAELDVARYAGTRSKAKYTTALAKLQEFKKQAKKLWLLALDVATAQEKRLMDSTFPEMGAAFGFASIASAPAVVTAVADQAMPAPIDRPAFRVIQGFEPDTSIPMSGGGITSAPVWSTKRRARNWFAILTSDITKRGGIGRVFVDRVDGEKSPGDLYYKNFDRVLLNVGQAVEFGADTITGKDRFGRESRDVSRWYGLIVGMADGVLSLKKYSDMQSAYSAAGAYGKALLAAREKALAERDQPSLDSIPLVMTDADATGADDDFGGAVADSTPVPEEFGGAAEMMIVTVPRYRIITLPKMSLRKAADQIASVRAENTGKEPWSLDLFSDHEKMNAVVHGQWIAKVAVLDDNGVEIDSSFRFSDPPGYVLDEYQPATAKIDVGDGGILINLEMPTWEPSDDSETAWPFSAYMVMAMAIGEMNGSLRHKSIATGTDDYKAARFYMDESVILHGGVDYTVNQIRSRLEAHGCSVESVVTAAPDVLSRMDNYSQSTHLYTGPVLAVKAIPGSLDLEMLVIVTAKDYPAFAAIGHDFRAALGRSSTQRTDRNDYHHVWTITRNVGAFGKAGESRRKKVEALLSKTFGSNLLIAVNEGDLPNGYFRPVNKKTSGIYRLDTFRLVKPEMMPSAAVAESPAIGDDSVPSIASVPLVVSPVAEDRAPSVGIQQARLVDPKTLAERHMTARVSVQPISGFTVQLFHDTGPAHQHSVEILRNALAGLRPAAGLRNYIKGATTFAGEETETRSTGSQATIFSAGSLEDTVSVSFVEPVGDWEEERIRELALYVDSAITVLNGLGYVTEVVGWELPDDRLGKAEFNVPISAAEIDALGFEPIYSTNAEDIFVVRNTDRGNYSSPPDHKFVISAQTRAYDDEHRSNTMKWQTVNHLLADSLCVVFFGNEQLGGSGDTNHSGYFFGVVRGAVSRESGDHMAVVDLFSQPADFGKRLFKPYPDIAETLRVTGENYKEEEGAYLSWDSQGGDVTIDVGAEGAKFKGRRVVIDLENCAVIPVGQLPRSADAAPSSDYFISFSVSSGDDIDAIPFISFFVPSSSGKNGGIENVSGCYDMRPVGPMCMESRASDTSGYVSTAIQLLHESVGSVTLALENAGIVPEDYDYRKRLSWRVDGLNLTLRVEDCDKLSADGVSKAQRDEMVARFGIEIESRLRGARDRWKKTLPSFLGFRYVPDASIAVWDRRLRGTQVATNEEPKAEEKTEAPKAAEVSPAGDRRAKMEALKARLEAGLKGMAK